MQSFCLLKCYFPATRQNHLRKKPRSLEGSWQGVKGAEGQTLHSTFHQTLKCGQRREKTKMIPNANEHQIGNKAAGIKMFPTTSYKDFLSNTKTSGKQQYSHPMAALTQHNKHSLPLFVNYWILYFINTLQLKHSWRAQCLRVEPSAENLNAIIFKGNKMKEKRIKKNYKIKINFSENIPLQNEELKAR